MSALIKILEHKIFLGQHFGENMMSSAVERVLMQFLHLMPQVQSYNLFVKRAKCVKTLSVYKSAQYEYLLQILTMKEGERNTSKDNNSVNSSCKPKNR